MALDAVIGLGSNLGDSRAMLCEAARRLGAVGEIQAHSALYESEPVGPPQPSFRNAAVRLLAELSPDALLDALLDIERGLGRVRRERWGPRLIDLDVLWLAGAAFVSDRLVVPHAELRNRAFALCPLLDVAPDAADPHDGVRYADVLAELGRQGVVELPGTRSSWC
jgi:2-amino-4-hydroxy-6-hydroxymethyldihydropteridine diphosphokinase